ncbi:uncharacterized protein LOC119991518 [Tripterygium wilfordii]|uniref:uncharacterized protein LOC119991518 n=1 Tax=Tripterygium wilfordii TaxID=458696 RepID=UPI0018F817A6|nr:uncharacterized protein LOC119991518 [Tripterygium wilfordii]
MATDTSTNIPPPVATIPSPTATYPAAIVPSNPSQNLITINIAAQLPLKLTSISYFSWKAQFTALFFGLDLLGYLYGTSECPSKSIDSNGKSVPNPYKKAWTRLSRLYAKRSNIHSIHLKDKLSMIITVVDFLISIKKIANELSALGAPPSDADLLLYSSRGLGPAYKELVVDLRTRDSVVPFEELFDKIIDHETFLIHNDTNPVPPPPTANLTKSSRPPYHSSPTPSRSLGILPTPSFRHKPSRNPATVAVYQFCDKHGHEAKKLFKLFPNP